MLKTTLCATVFFGMLSSGIVMGQPFNDARQIRIQGQERINVPGDESDGDDNYNLGPVTSSIMDNFYATLQTSPLTAFGEVQGTSGVYYYSGAVQCASLIMKNNQSTYQANAFARGLGITDAKGEFKTTGNAVAVTCNVKYANPENAVKGGIVVALYDGTTFSNIGLAGAEHLFDNTWRERTLDEDGENVRLEDETTTGSQRHTVSAVQTFNEPAGFWAKPSAAAKLELEARNATGFPATTNGTATASLTAY